ncbi:MULTISPECIES: fatty acid desaturase family protein [Marinobacter]|uniref:Acyl-CoA desaturase n=1 Tax=Marinobacter xiaoshiensis TaxID=3073652 RepID=A0ABU2HK10_9GAMM|nr:MULTISPECIES: acyl-CoA desaturase [unclassified Marinobacter]MBK1873708.1 acyl-CoA desaturase [Marinobacter sp. 1-3A]MDS1311408.1 acyl-CoA desaturase [Marinobacter sp. F60267]
MSQMTEDQLQELAQDLNSIRDEIVADLGERDANYIRRVIRLHRALEVGGRVMMPFGFIPPVFVAATVSLGLSKIIENMEIGHNVMHGQYDWMNDPSLHSQTYEWDTACSSDSWRRTHNYEHHTYTNIIGKDRDYGYALLRLSDDEQWHPAHSLQFLSYVMLSVFFQWGVGLHELEFERVRRGEIRLRDKLPFLKDALHKGGRQAFKDYVFFPLITFPVAPIVLAGNLGANLMRNLWSSTVIFCGHFTEDAETFDEKDCENESKGHWYLRQLTGSSNFTGNKLIHLLSGHLSYQIEHHVFPDLPAHRYPEVSERVQSVCRKHGIRYNTGSFRHQYGTVVKRILKYSLPDRLRMRLESQPA